jgi:hypothetical protein
LTLLASAVASSADLNVGPEVLEVLNRVALPERITGEVILRYVRRAVRLGIWRRLRPESRALLLVARRFEVLRSPVVTSIVRRLLLEVEVHTLRGRALLYGVLIALRDPFLRLAGVLRDVTKLLVLGISYLNNPPLLRFYG